MADGFFPNDVNIYIVSANTAGSAIASSDKITTDVTNFNLTGGSKEVEQQALFGNAFLSIEKPRDQYELSLDVIPKTDYPVRYEALLMGGSLTSTSCESSTEPLAKKIFIEMLSGTSYKTMAINNCKGVTFEPEMGSEEYLKGSIKFKFSPTTDAGASNYKVAAVAASNAFFN